MIRTWVRILLLPETKIRTLSRPLHRRCPKSLAGSKWKTGDVQPNYTCRKTGGKKEEKKPSSVFSILDRPLVCVVINICNKDVTLYVTLLEKKRSKGVMGGPVATGRVVIRCDSKDVLGGHVGGHWERCIKDVTVQMYWVDLWMATGRGVIKT